MITTEALLTSKLGFDVPATPVQRAACRARDGLPLRELAHHPDVVWAFGGPDAVAALPGERGIKPAEFWLLAAPRTAKTTIACAAAIVDTQIVDDSGVGVGEVPRVSIISLKLDLADVPFRRALGCVQGSPVLSRLLLRHDATSFELRTPRGKVVEFATTAGGKAAGGIAARWSFGVMFDEGPKMDGREDAVANLDDGLSVARERMLPGAQIMPIGSPWGPSGPFYDTVQERFGKPDATTVVMKMTGPAANPSHWTPERMARLEARDPIAFRIVAFCEFLDPESGLLNPIAVRTHTRSEPLELPPEDGASYAAAVDVGKGRWTLCIVEAYEAAEDKLAYFRVALAREFLGTDPTEPWGQIAATCQRYGIKTASVDQYAASESNAIAKRYGLQLIERPWNAGNKLEAFTDLATLVHAGRVEFPPDRAFRRDLLAVKKRTTAAGYTIHLPHTSDGRHCDFAPALAAAAKQAASSLRSGSVRIFFSEPSERAFHTSSSRRGKDYSLPPDERVRRFLNQE